MSKRYLNRVIVITVRHLFIACVLFDIVAVARRMEHVPEYDAMREKMETKQLPSKPLVDAPRKGQYFQDIFSEHLAPLKIEFGHVCENPKEWEQRFERKDLGKNHHQGKVIGVTFVGDDLIYSRNDMTRRRFVGETRMANTVNITGTCITAPNSLSLIEITASATIITVPIITFAVRADSSSIAYTKINYTFNEDREM